MSIQLLQLLKRKFRSCFIHLEFIANEFNKIEKYFGTNNTTTYFLTKFDIKASSINLH